MSYRGTCTNTNLYVLDRMNSFSGEIRLIKAEGGQMQIEPETRGVIRRILKEAGKSNPALCRFVIHKGIGYLIPHGVEFTEVNK